MIAVAGVFVACSQEPQSYEDCVLKAMEGGGKSDLAVRVIEAACREKCPAQPEPSEPSLPSPPPASGRPQTSATQPPRERSRWPLLERVLADLACSNCVEVSFSSLSGESNLGGLCDRLSRLEFDEDGSIVFTCLNIGKRGKAVVFKVDDLPKGLRLSTEKGALFLHRTLAGCARIIEKQTPTDGGEAEMEVAR